MKSLLMIVVTFVAACMNELNASSNRNIALKRPIYPSCGTELVNDSPITDDNIDDISNLMIEVSCRATPWLVRIAVTLPPTKMIGSVIIYAGECRDCDQLLDNFKVEMTFEIDPSKRKICGHFIGEFMPPGVPMRVNCNINETWDQPVTEVGIYPTSEQMASFKKASVSEIEVNLMEYSSDPGYYGCYADFSDQFEAVANGSCKMTCFAKGYRFMNLRNDGSCHCTNNAPLNLIENDRCPQACPTEVGLMCGSKRTYSVYIARAPHMYSPGCYNATVPGDATEAEEIAVLACLKECSQKDKVYAFLQNQKFCYCKDELPPQDSIVEAGKCKCSGQNTGCGGPESALVFTGCIDRNEQTPCDEIYNCENGNIDEFGVCFGSCEDGWIGKYCLARVPGVQVASSTVNEPDATPDVSGLLITGKTEKFLKGEVISLPSTSNAPTPQPSTKSAKTTTAKMETEEAEREGKVFTSRFIFEPTHGMSEKCREALEEIRNKYLTEVPEYLPPSSENVEEYADELLYDREIRFPPEIVMLLLMFIMAASTGIGIAYGYFLAKGHIRRKTMALHVSKEVLTET